MALRHLRLLLDRLLAIDVGRTWTERDAELWWRTHLPDLANPQGLGRNVSGG